MARRRKGRAIDGVFLLDKPLGESSNHALQRVKRAFGAAKAGHTGALDPLATGMLPICLGEATKFSQFLLDADKTYQVEATLGVRTTTSDADGDIVEQKDVQVTEDAIRQTCLEHVGLINQVPSMFSALKYEGNPLYYYARLGIDIARYPRQVTIFDISISHIADNKVTMQVHCSKGTYIRTLVDDIGQQLGCGAFVSKLHRTRVADYPVDKVLSFEQLDEMIVRNEQAGKDYKELDATLLPMDTAVKALPLVNLPQQAAHFYCHGQDVQSADVAQLDMDSQVRVYSGELFLGVGEVKEHGRVAPKRLVMNASDNTKLV